MASSSPADCCLMFLICCNEPFAVCMALVRPRFAETCLAALGLCTVPEPTPPAQTPPPSTWGLDPVARERSPPLFEEVYPARLARGCMQHGCTYPLSSFESFSPFHDSFGKDHTGANYIRNVVAPPAGGESPLPPGWPYGPPALVPPAPPSPDAGIDGGSSCLEMLWGFFTQAEIVIPPRQPAADGRITFRVLTSYEGNRTQQQLALTDNMPDGCDQTLPRDAFCTRCSASALNLLAMRADNTYCCNVCIPTSCNRCTRGLDRLPTVWNWWTPTVEVELRMIYASTEFISDHNRAVALQRDVVKRSSQMALVNSVGGRQRVDADRFVMHHLHTMAHLQVALLEVPRGLFQEGALYARAFQRVSCPVGTRGGSRITGACPFQEFSQSEARASADLFPAPPLSIEDAAPGDMPVAAGPPSSHGPAGPPDVPASTSQPPPSGASHDFEMRSPPPAGLLGEQQRINSFLDDEHMHDAMGGRLPMVKIGPAAFKGEAYEYLSKIVKKKHPELAEALSFSETATLSHNGLRDVHPFAMGVGKSFLNFGDSEKDPYVRRAGPQLPGFGGIVFDNNCFHTAAFGAAMRSAAQELHLPDAPASRRFEKYCAKADASIFSVKEIDKALKDMPPITELLRSKLSATSVHDLQSIMSAYTPEAIEALKRTGFAKFEAIVKGGKPPRIVQDEGMLLLAMNTPIAWIFERIYFRHFRKHCIKGRDRDDVAAGIMKDYSNGGYAGDDRNGTCPLAATSIIEVDQTGMELHERWNKETGEGLHKWVFKILKKIAKRCEGRCLDFAVNWWNLRVAVDEAGMQYVVFDKNSANGHIKMAPLRFCFEDWYMPSGWRFTSSINHFVEFAATMCSLCMNPEIIFNQAASNPETTWVNGVKKVIEHGCYFFAQADPLHMPKSKWAQKPFHHRYIPIGDPLPHDEKKSKNKKKGEHHRVFETVLIHLTVEGDDVQGIVAAALAKREKLIAAAFKDLGFSTKLKFVDDGRAEFCGMHFAVKGGRIDKSVAWVPDIARSLSKIGTILVTRGNVAIIATSRYLSLAAMFAGRCEPMAYTYLGIARSWRQEIKTNKEATKAVRLWTPTELDKQVAGSFLNHLPHFENPTDFSATQTPPLYQYFEKVEQEVMGGQYPRPAIQAAAVVNSTGKPVSEREFIHWTQIARGIDHNSLGSELNAGLPFSLRRG